ncbi:hypothetical protein CKAN_00719200 [Cinnamomum micranthum f. kanehirae]|uniref:Uncharacterized protein n=1 Tax=Cinnamomum micranthum f. kanehirae TaxID=337451 RepID=A0A443NJC7_9MAGN|nr:hypothetical protein CKAN_00719200 [Cinnamomum micranthum f. kanehirae]
MVKFPKKNIESNFADFGGCKASCMDLFLGPERTCLVDTVDLTFILYVLCVVFRYQDPVAIFFVIARILFRVLSHDMSNHCCFSWKELLALVVTCKTVFFFLMAVNLLLPSLHVIVFWILLLSSSYIAFGL